MECRKALDNFVYEDVYVVVHMHKGCSRNYPGGGGPQTLFCPVGGGRFIDNVSEGWGGGEVTCPGGQGVFDP